MKQSICNFGLLVKMLSNLVYDSVTSQEVLGKAFFLAFEKAFRLLILKLIGNSVLSKFTSSNLPPYD